MSNSFCIIYCSRKVVRAEVVQKMSSICIHFCIHFLRNNQKQRVLDQTPRHRSLIGLGVAIVTPCLFRETHKGFQRIHSSTNKGNNSAIKYRHFTDTFVCSIIITIKYNSDLLEYDRNHIYIFLLIIHLFSYSPLLS